MRVAASLAAQLKDRHVLVVGLGTTGSSCVRFLRRLGVRVSAVDSRAAPPAAAAIAGHFPKVPMTLGSLAPAALADADVVVVSPGVAAEEPLLQAARRRGLPVMGDIELFARAVEGAHARIVAVTGSNGKSTVATLAALMLAAAGMRVAAGANLGTPALDLLDEAPDVYVLELSSFQLEFTESLRSNAAAVLNVSPDHMDRHGSLERYAAIKARIFRNAGVAVVNRDDARVAAMPAGLARPPARVVGFTLDAPAPGDYGLAQADGQPWLSRGARRLMPLARMRLRGLHNAANGLAALALGESLGADIEPMLSSLASFTGLAHRCQWVAERDGVTWINDSKGTNVGATLAALEGLPGPIVLLAGGLAKGGDFRPLAPVLRAKARALVLFGRDADAIAAAVEGAAPINRVDSLDEAVVAAKNMARSGDTVLLSPGCASFDMFRDYADRGERFMDAVRRLDPCAA